MSPNRLVILIHPDATWRDRMSLGLSHTGVQTLTFASIEDCPPIDDAESVDAIVLRVEVGAKDKVANVLIDLDHSISKRPTIAVLAQSDAEAIRAAFKAGCFDCLVEDCEPEDIIRSLGSIRKSSQIQPASTPVSSSRATESSAATRIMSYGCFSEMFSGLRAVCRQRSEPLTIAIFDLDRFRTLNELVSPAMADTVLSWFLTILQGNLRRGDLLVQMHIDRFLVAWPQVRAVQGRQVAQRCQQLMSTNLPTFDGRQFEITTTVGLVECSHGFLESEHQLIYRARLALEHGKHLGGNRVVNWLEMNDNPGGENDLRKMDVGRISHWMRRAREEVRQTCLETTLALVGAVEAKDPYTRAHSMTVADYAEAIGREMRLNEPMMATLRAGALLHDVGKIGVPDAILTKPSSLTAEEFQIIKKHPQTALDILEHVSFVSEERPLILHHHERHDGLGYPYGLAGDQIPIGARVLAVADAIDAMLSPRSYKNAYPLERVTDELRLGAGKQFDPNVAEVALRWLRCSSTRLQGSVARRGDSKVDERVQEPAIAQ